jgi:hypothetical protein
MNQLDYLTANLNSHGNCSLTSLVSPNEPTGVDENAAGNATL